MPTSNGVLGCVVVLFLLAGCTQRAVEDDAPQLNEEIAYLRLTGAYWQVWLTDPEGGGHRQLTTSDGDKVRVSWSLDRKHILCNRNDGSVAIVDLASGEERVLDTPITGMVDAQWSPDGNWIMFTLAPPQSPDTNDVWIMKTQGKEKRKLTNQPGGAKTPSWHPDGGRVVYTSSTPANSQELWVVSIDGKNLTQLTSGEGFKFDPVYNQHDDLLYSANMDGDYDLWLLPGVGGAPKQLTNDRAFDAQPSWAPDGERFVFYSLRDNGKRLWVMNANTQAITPITPLDVVSRYPAWAPGHLE
jgi:Tol biopolymer transport system component